MGVKNSKESKLKTEETTGQSKCPVKVFKNRSLRVATRCLGCMKLNCFKSVPSSPMPSTVESISSPAKSAGECPFKPRKPCAESGNEHDKVALLNENSVAKCPFKSDACKKNSSGRVEFIIDQHEKSKESCVTSSMSNSSFSEFYDFSTNEKQLISFSFELIKHDLSTVGVIAFMKSFETVPTMKDNYEFLRGTKMDELSTSHALRTHSTKVMRVIGEFVTKIFSNETDQLKEKLTGLGSRHCIYGAGKEHLILIENQFIHSIRPILLKGLNQAGIRNTIGPLFTPGFTKIASKELDEPTSQVDDTPLSDEEIENALKAIDEQWHNVFRSIRNCMMAGISDRK